MPGKPRIPADMLDPLASTAAPKRKAAAPEAPPAEPPVPDRGGRRRHSGLGGVKPIRCTVYLTPNQYGRLRAEVDRRLAAMGFPEVEVKAHDRPDLSALVREAVAATFPEGK